MNRLLIVLFFALLILIVLNKEKFSVRNFNFPIKKDL